MEREYIFIKKIISIESSSDESEYFINFKCQMEYYDDIKQGSGLIVNNDQSIILFTNLILDSGEIEVILSPSKMTKTSMSKYIKNKWSVVKSEKDTERYKLLYKVYIPFSYSLHSK